MAGPDKLQTEDGPHHLASEETPLLTEGTTATAPEEDEEDPRDRYKWPVIFLTFSLIFLLELAIGISTPAWNALLEKGLCAEAYPDFAQTLVEGDGSPCKGKAVQGKLAMYRGWSYTLDCIPTILLAVPYGFLSDKWGRKPVAILSFVGIALVTVCYEVVFYFPLPMWTFLVASAWYMIGGGTVVGTSMLYTTLADVVPADELASVLFRFFAIFMVGSLIANPLGGFLLSQGPWVALLTGNLFMLISVATLYLMPETLVVRRWHDAKAAGKTGGPSPSLMPQESDDEEGLKKSAFRATVDTAQTQLLHGLDFLVSNKRVVVLMLPLIFETVEKYIEELLMQYATKRYGWSWSKASYVLTLKSASYIIMLTVLLPAISSFCLSTLGMSPLKKDLWLARCSGAVLILADLVITFSYTPALYALGLVLLAGGCGLPPLLRSLLNALVEPHHVGILNTLLGFLDTLGVMVAAPIFSQALSKGIELGGGWIGLPFAAGACIAAMAAGILGVYRLPALPQDGGGGGGGGGQSW